MSEMVERVARAIHDAVRQPVKELWPLYDDDTLEARIRSGAIAHAAIAAMLEPTEAMVARGIAQSDECNDAMDGSAACTAEHVWGAMVNEALR